MCSRIKTSEHIEGREAKAKQQKDVSQHAKKVACPFRTAQPTEVDLSTPIVLSSANERKLWQATGLVDTAVTSKSKGYKATGRSQHPLGETFWKTSTTVGTLRAQHKGPGLGGMTNLPKI